MKREGLENLIEEFEKTCGKEDAKDSANAALFIKNSFNYERSDELKLNFLKQLKKDNQEISTSRYILLPLLLAILLIFGFVYKVEASKPGDMFYPVKEFSTLIQDNVKKVAQPYKIDPTTNVTVKPSITKSPKKNNKTPQEPANETINKNATPQKIIPTIPAKKGVVEEIREELEKPINETKETVDEVVENVIEIKVPEVTQVPPILQNTLGL